jgi:hypothetical protein
LRVVSLGACALQGLRYPPCTTVHDPSPCRIWTP